MLEFDYENQSEAEILLKAYSIQVYKKEYEPGVHSFEFTSSEDLSFRLSNTTNHSIPNKELKDNNS